MIKILSKLTEADCVQTGRKAYHLGLLLQHGIQGIDGFVLYGTITAQDFRVVYALADPQKHYAVRSSMSGEDTDITSSAGKYRTLLGIEFADIEEAVYEILKHAGNCGQKAVVIQELLEVEASGILFTKDPITGKGMVINAVLGIGENLASGEENPDVFRIEGRITDQVVLEKKAVYSYQYHAPAGDEVILNQVRSTVIMNYQGRTAYNIHPEDRRLPALTEKQVYLAAAEAEKIKNLFQQDQDIEFAVCRDTIYYLQSRPVAELKNKNFCRPERKKIYIKGTTLYGQRVSFGTFLGRAACVEHGKDYKNMEGLVLVAEEFYPGLIYEMDHVSAIVTAKGGALSHAAIAAREKGIPCVTGLNQDIDKIKDGMELYVDAERGEVILIS